MSDSAFVAARVARPATSEIRIIRQTGFYPLYDGDNDQVDPVGPVRRVGFQRVVPRYRLSSSETTDTGLGPPFYEIPVLVPGRSDVEDSRVAKPAAASASAAAVGSRPAPLQPWQANQVDVFA